MNQFFVNCPKCKQLLDVDQYNRPQLLPCPACGVELQVFAYPAIYRKERNSGAATAATLEDAACYYHPEKQAEKVCDSCGRFLCTLCELPFNEEIVCASCLEVMRNKEGQMKLRPRQIRYDKIASYLALLPLIYFILTLFTAPAAVFVVIRYWKNPGTFAPGYRGRMIMALIVALLEIMGWIIGGVAFVQSIRAGEF